jgi:hypothetical protein
VSVGVSEMVRRYSRCREKFIDAERRLAVGEGDVRDRLRSAYKKLRMLSENDVPPAMTPDFVWIMRQLTQYGPEADLDGTVYKSAIDHTMARIRNVTGRRIAERIYNLRWRLSQ